MNLVISVATGTIGSALARLLHARGDAPLLCGRSDVKLAALNQALGGVYRALVADLAASERNAPLQRNVTQIGLIDTLACSVGPTVVRPLHLTSDGDWNEHRAVNATSESHVVKCFDVGREVSSTRHAWRVRATSIAPRQIPTPLPPSTVLSRSKLRRGRLPAPGGGRQP